MVSLHTPDDSPAVRHRLRLHDDRLSARGHPHPDDLQQGARPEAPGRLDGSDDGGGLRLSCPRPRLRRRHLHAFRHLPHLRYHRSYPPLLHAGDGAGAREAGATRGEGPRRGRG